MAISKKEKKELVAQYVEWMNNSQAFFLTEYTGLSMKDFDNLRQKIREAGGEFPGHGQACNEQATSQNSIVRHSLVCGGSAAVLTGAFVTVSTIRLTSGRRALCSQAT